MTVSRQPYTGQLTTDALNNYTDCHKQSMRQCVLTRNVVPKNELLRFVCDPSGKIVPDLKAHLPGRGVWITARKKGIVLAVQKNIFAKTLRKNITVEPDLAETVEDLIKKRTLNAFSLAKKAGVLAFGFDMVKNVLVKNQAHGLILAKDAAENTVSKLKKIVLKTSDNQNSLPIFCFFKAEELSSAINKTNVMYAALTAQKIGAKNDKKAIYPHNTNGHLFLNWALRLKFYYEDYKISDDI